MPWVGTPGSQTFQRTDGTRTGTQVWQQADAASVDIVAPDHDLHDQDIANGLQQALKKDGGNSASANIPMGGFRFTNVGAASARNSSVNTADVQDGRLMFCTVSGTRNAISLTPPIDISSYISGQTFRFIPTDNNTGAVTVAISGLAAKAVKVNGTDLTAGQILSGSVVTITFAVDHFEMESGAVPAAIGVGSVLIWPLDDVPADCLEADGSAVSRTDWSELFSLYGTKYGSGDGSTTFNLPNYQDYFLRGYSATGTDAASRTDRGDGTTGANVGTKQADQIKSHHHDFTGNPVGNHTHGSGTGDGGYLIGGSAGGAAGYAGGSAYSKINQAAATAGGGAHTPSGTISDTGGTETRPKNITVKFIIIAKPSAAIALTNMVGDPGWSPALAIVADGSRNVFQVSDWVGGSGTKPAVGDYVGSTGLVSNIADAIDVTGSPGADGWSPILALASDGARRVLEVTDWTGGTGTKPAVNKYIGTTGLVDLIADGVDVRGAQGDVGPSLNPLGSYSSGTAYAQYDIVLDQGSTWVALQSTTGNAPPTLPTTSNTYWQLLAQKGTDGAGSGDVVGPASATDSAIALFDGTGGKIIKDSAVLLSDLATSAQGTKADTAVQSADIDTDGTLAADSDAKIPSQKAVKTYVDAHASGGTPANPSASVALTPVNGSASTYMRSDAAPPLSQSIAPTWTGKHTFSAGVLHSGSPFADTFVGSGLGAYFWENMNVSASHASKPEIGAQFNVTSNVGISNVVTITIASPAVITLNDHPFKAGHGIVFNTTGALPTGITGGVTYYVSTAGLTANSFQVADTQAHALAGTNSVNTSGTQSGTQVVDTRAYCYKIGLFSSCLGDTNSASVYGINTVTQGHAGSGGYLVTGVESDINNIGADAPTIGTDTSAYGFVSVGAGNFKSTAAYWAIGTTAGGWHYGFATSNNVSDVGFIDTSSAAISFNGANGILVGTTAKTRQSQIHGYAAANSLQIVERIENDNGGSGVAAIGFQVTNSSGETRSAKAGIGFTRAAANGRGSLTLYNRIINDTSDFTTGDAVMAWDSNNILQFIASTAFTANGTVATAMSSVGPTGAHTTVQKWLTIKDGSGSTFYIPCF